ncbi:MAG: hypothetical protein KJ720_01790 [Proteobacteria bacterium]|nr:hypothetical protein [Pseudomonadota bacterium]MBU1451170.1 hypothetical protein [Pseudomonadota bacterium]
MSDLRIQYDEEMVGADHPTKEDTLNRLMLAEHDSAGLHQRATLVVQGADPDTGAGQAALYTKESGGLAELFFRGAGGGEVLQLTKAGAVSAGAPAAITGCLPAWSSASAFTLGSGALDIGGSLFEIPGAITKTGQSGFAANTWLYLKVYAPASGNEIDAAAVALDATTPQWSDAYKAWYIGTERVVGVMRSDGSGGLAAFSCDGKIFQLSTTSIFALSTSSPATTATALSVGLPALGRLWWYGQAYLNQANAQTYWVYMGSDGTEGSAAGAIAKQNAPGEYVTPFSMMSNASGNVYYHVFWSGSGSLQIHCRGFALPAGMAR